MKKVHLIGIGGSGLSAIARLLHEKGYQVSGSDQVASSVTHMLSSSGIQVFIGHQAQQIRGADVVVHSSAINDENPEIRAAHQAGIPVLKRSEFLGNLLQDYRCIAIAGTHGKTTTTAMTAWALTCLGEDPSYLIGGISRNLSSNAHAGKGEFFVIEADEYDRMFLGLSPAFALITNIEHDHPDCFPTQSEYFQAFIDFSRSVRPGGTLIVNHDDQKTNCLIQLPSSADTKLTYGLAEGSTYRVVNLNMLPDGSYRFDAMYEPEGSADQRLGSFSLSIPGLHNVSNALGALAILHQAGFSAFDLAGCLEQFSGTERRFQVFAEVKGITLIDDYAHHATEIRITLQTAHQSYKNRKLICVWQPHTFSRIKAFYEDYLLAFEDADQVIVTEIYAARETGDYSAQKILKELNHKNKLFLPGTDEIIEYLSKHLVPGDVLLVLSAGDAIEINKRLLEKLKLQGSAEIDFTSPQARNKDSKLEKGT